MQRTAPLTDATITDRGDFVGAWAIYAPRADGVVGLSWQFGDGGVNPGLYNDWFPWLCFNVVPGAFRVSSSYSASALRHVFTSTLEGKLYVRVGEVEGWRESWEEMQPPYPGEALLDIAATGAPGETTLYVISEGEVLVTSRSGADSGSRFGAWHSLGPLAARRIGAASLAGDASEPVRNLVAILDSRGQAWIATGTPAEPQGELAVWEHVPAPVEFTAIEVAAQIPPRVGDTPRVLALDGDGAVWHCADAEACVWQVLKPADEPPKLKTLSAAMHEGKLSLVGVDDSGIVSISEAPWTDWAELHWPE